MSAERTDFVENGEDRFRRSLDNDGWKSYGNCLDVDAEILYPDWEDALTIEVAKAMCRSCTVATTCRTYAEEHEEEFGIWGGLTELERPEAANPERDFIIATRNLAVVPLLAERAMVLLPHHARTLFLEQLDSIAVKSSDEQIADLTLLRDTKNMGNHTRLMGSVPELAQRLLDGTLDCGEWIKSIRGRCLPSPITFLTKLEQPVGPREPMDDLRQRSLGELTAYLTDGMHMLDKYDNFDVFVRLYNLKGEGWTNLNEVAAENGFVAKTVERRVQEFFRSVRLEKQAGAA